MNTLELSVNQSEDFLATGFASTLVSGQSVLKSGDLITVCDRQCVVQSVRAEPHYPAESTPASSCYAAHPAPSAQHTAGRIL